MEWISVKERLPEDRKPVLVYTGGGFICKAYWFNTNDSIEWISFVNFEDIEEYVTHWMPLPEPPK